jgi:ribosomal-protein-alanine N-acetyltransferase
MSLLDGFWFIERMEDDFDLEKVLSIESASFSNYNGRELFLKDLARPEFASLHVVRSQSGQIAGYCSSWLVSDELHINTIAIESLMRRRGAGSSLLTQVLRESKNRGAKRATLEVRASNDAAKKLYLQFGFFVAGIRRGYYSNPSEDALILWRNKL